MHLLCFKVLKRLSHVFLYPLHLSSCAITFSLFPNNYYWSGPVERVLYFSTDFVMFNLIQSYRCPIPIGLIDLLMQINTVRVYEVTDG